MRREEATHDICVRNRSEMRSDVMACSTNRDMMMLVDVSARNAHHAQVVDLEGLTAGRHGGDVREKTAHGAVVEGLHERDADSELRQDELQPQRIHHLGSHEEEKRDDEVDQPHLADGINDLGPVHQEGEDGIDAQTQDDGKENEPQDSAEA